MSEHELGVDRSKHLDYKAPPHDMPRWTFDDVMGKPRTIPANTAAEAYKVWAGEPDHGPLVSVYARHLGTVVALPENILRDQDKDYRKPEGYLPIWGRLAAWAEDAKAQHDIEDEDGIVAEAVAVMARMKGNAE